MDDNGAEFGERQHRWRWWHAALLSAMVLLALSPFDLPVARLCYSQAQHRAVVRVLEVISNVAGEGRGVICVLTVAAVAGLILRGTKISRIPLLLSITYGGGLLADIIKLCIWRYRP